MTVGASRHSSLGEILPPQPPGPAFLYEWWAPPADDEVPLYLTRQVRRGSSTTAGWTCARLSKAAYIYREPGEDRRYLAKFYSAKTPGTAEQHADRELAATRAALATSLGEGGRACDALGSWRGVLFLEYVDGLTLDDLIAVRRDRPGMLGPALDSTGQLLAALHVSAAGAIERGEHPDLGRRDSLTEADGFLRDLGRSSVLAGEFVLSDGLRRQLDAWSARPVLREFGPTLIHGDATTTNFVFPSGTETVAVDWERLAVGDPADDVGRLIAEVANGVQNHGGPAAEAEAAVDRILKAYIRQLPKGAPDDGFTERLRFHRASSTLRMARNGWLTQFDRIRLVAQASALLAS